jgi:hypothetical protein
MPYPPGWGSYPALGGDDDKVKALEARLAEQEARNRENEHQRQMDALREDMRQAQSQTNSVLEKLAAAITETRNAPTGPSPAELEMRARLDAAEKRAEDTRRDAETRDREERLRREIETSRQETARMLAELKTNQGPDPVVTMMTQLMGTMNQSNAAMVASIEKAGSSASESSREYMRLLSDRMGSSAMTPEKTLELIRLAKDNGPQAEANKGLSEMYATVFGMAKDLLVLRSEMEGPGEPAWIPMAREGIARIGAVAQAVAQTKVREETRAEHAEQRAAAERAAVIRARRAAQAQAQAQAAQHAAGAIQGAAAAPQVAAAPVDPRSESQKIRDAAADQIGLRSKPAANSAQAIRDAAAADMGLVPGGVGKATPVEQAAPAQAAPRGRAPASTLTIVPDDVVQPGGDYEDDEDGDEGVEVEAIENEDEDTVRTAIAGISDQEFFGSVYGHVVQLREQVEDGEGLPVADCADFVLQAIQFIQGAGEYPPALELLHNQHVEIMIERLLPNATEEYRDALAEELQRIGNEAAQGSAG